MNTLQALYPFFVGWLLGVAYVVQAVVYIARSYEWGYNQTRWDIARQLARRLDWVMVIFGPIVVGIVVECIWWLLAFPMGVQAPV